jgi:molybdate-binding protein
MKLSGTPARLHLAKVRERWIGLPADSKAQLAGGLKSADAVLDVKAKGTRALPFRSGQELEANLLLLGCDPALGILREWMAGRSKGGRMIWAGASSQKALDGLEAGEAHVAGVHFKSWTEEANQTQAARIRTPEGTVLVRFANWEQGWMVARGNPKKIREAADLAQPGIRFINREKGSGSRFLTDALLKKLRIPARAITGYAQMAESHAEGAEKVSAGEADAAVGLRTVAMAYDLDFVPIDQVSFDLVIPVDFMGHPSMVQLMDLLQGRALRAELQSLPGYDTSETGKIVAQLPAVKGR